MSNKTIFLVAFLSLGLLGFRFIAFFQNMPTYTNGQEVKLQVVLQEAPEISNRGQRFIVKTRENRRISIQASLSKLYHYGDKLAIIGKLQVKRNEKGYEFLTLYFPKIVVDEIVSNPFFEASRFVRERSTALFDKTLPPISSSLLLGIIFGSNEHFPQDFKDALQRTGVLHVIAASGMNVSFFTGAIMFSLGAIMKRRIALFLSIFAVIFYSFLVGFEPSILRASIMAIVAITASFFGRQNLAVLALFGTGFLMLLWLPSYLFDVGFQLSFLATLGILLINPIFGRLKVWFVGEDLKTTLSAEIATLPILLGTFGNVGLLGTLVNMLVLWTVPILMLLGSLAVIAGLVVPPLGQMLLYLSLPFLLFFEILVSSFGSLGWSFAIETFPWELAVGYYLVIGAVILLARKRIHDQ